MNEPTIEEMKARALAFLKEQRDFLPAFPVKEKAREFAAHQLAGIEATERAVLLLDELECARRTIAATEAACFAVCKDNTREVLDQEPHDDVGRFLSTDEDGDPIIDAETAAEVITQICSAWERVSEAYAKQHDENRALRLTVITHEKQITKLDSRVRRAVAVVARTWCDKYGNPREGEGLPSAAVHQLTDVLMGFNDVEPVAEGAS